MVFKGVESATSATIVSAWTAYVVICRYWIDYGILDTTQCFATEVFMWSTQFSMDTYYFGRFDFSRTLLVFFTFIAVIATFYDWFPSLDVLPVPSFLGHPTVPTTPAVATVPTPSSALIRPIHQSSPPSSISTRAITQTSPSPLAYERSATAAISQSSPDNGANFVESGFHDFFCEPNDATVSFSRCTPRAVVSQSSNYSNHSCCGTVANSIIRFDRANPSILASSLHFVGSNYSNLASTFSLRLAIDFLTIEVL
ncbi:hypothetical protein CDL15_Pgr021235 [Punica granatum]|uniref:Uncharacterized protein n=1 Tax=Punica granatum TaxID=22663 RepID=A0A218WPW3_PUNGR|nr:hypothetical protein CDL15_Pgr021235 [Punica granatum]